MAFLTIKNARIAGLSASVPANVEDNLKSGLFASAEDAERFIESTGVASRHVVKGDICSSDLCLAAAEKLIAELGWKKEEIDCLAFLSQTPDYISPATSCILQDRLGLSKDCMAFDISMGCSGWVYGLSMVASLVSSSGVKKALLLVGDTCTRTKSPYDNGSYALFGDAGSATAVVYDPEAPAMYFDMHTDGSGAGAIMIRDGGFRHPFSAESLVFHECEDGVKRCNIHSVMDGSSVFIFGISKAPHSIKALLEHFNLDKEQVDYFVMHQANLMMNEKIRKKLDIPAEKAPYIHHDFGNTSGVSIPLAIAVKLRNEIAAGKCRIVGCGFGVGLSWGTVYFELDKAVCPELTEI